MTAEERQWAAQPLTLPNGQQLWFRENFSVNQELPHGLQGFLRLGGQITDQPLITNEQMSQGGMDSVRGYPQAEYVGDQGYFVNVELRLPPYGLQELRVPYVDKPLKDVMQLALFFDHGEATVNRFCPENSGTARSPAWASACVFSLIIWPVSIWTGPIRSAATTPPTARIRPFM